MIDNADILVNYVRRCNAVTTDSRAIASLKEAGRVVMFFALKGEKYDGNDFVSAALEDGADFVVSDNLALEGSENRKLLLVKDSLKMMQLTALAYRRIVDPKVIAITGTNGKTTTKELVALALSKKYKTYATKGNLNNHIGVPLTILNMPKDCEVLVVEMGANHSDEISQLCKIAEPNYGLITNVGRAHLEGFGSFSGVCKAKGELYDYLKQSGGIAFYDSSNQNLAQMISDRMGIRKSEYNSADFRGEFNDKGELVISVKGKNIKIRTMLTGLYNSANIAASYTITTSFGIDYLTFVDAIQSYCPTNNRSQLIYNGSNIIIADAYNANPSSVEIAIKNLKHFVRANKVVILGAMKELGIESDKEHLKVIRNVQKSDINRAYFIGEEYEKVKIEGEKFKYYSSTEEFLNAFVGVQFDDSVVLIKGSRSMELEKVINKYR